MYFSSAILACLAGVLAVAAPSDTHRLHEKRDALGAAWTRGKEVPGHEVLPVRIGMRQQNLEHGDRLLLEVSDPESPRYGAHYTAEEVNDIFAPSTAAIDTIRTWLESAGIESHRVSQSWNKQWMEFDASAKELGNLLKTKYHEYVHEPTEGLHVACEEYYVPSHVAEHVDYITPGIKLLAPPHKARRSANGAIQKRAFGIPPITLPLPEPLSALLALPLDQLCGVAITPSCISTLYNITAPPTPAVQGNQLGIFEDLGDHYSADDLSLFFTTLATQIPSNTVPQNRLIDGATGASSSVLTAGPESDLDFQISYPIIYPQQTVLFQTDDDVYESNYTYDGFLNNFLDAIDGSYCTYKAFGETGNSPLDPPYPDPQTGGYKGKLQCGKYKPTNVITISYGGQEPDLPMSYQKRQCQEFMKLGMQGISIFVASGDSGVGSTQEGCIGTNGTVFNPDFPATCPYITTVGATVLPPTGSVYADQETAVTRFGSGGGFSNIYPIPSYQSSAVATYLTQHKPSYPSYSTTNNKAIGANGGIYNRNGRGYPDVSATGDNVVIFNMGAPTLIGGTSAASPLFAAVVNRINEERLKVGKKTVGFVNPTLYKNPGVLHDITVGNNPGCNTNGFNASTGWDPLTGLGTPNYPAMLKLFMSLP